MDIGRWRPLPRHKSIKRCYRSRTGRIVEAFAEAIHSASTASSRNYLGGSLDIPIKFSRFCEAKSIRQWLRKINLVAKHQRPDAFSKQLGFAPKELSRIYFPVPAERRKPSGITKTRGLAAFRYHQTLIRDSS